MSGVPRSRGTRRRAGTIEGELWFQGPVEGPCVCHGCGKPCSNYIQFADSWLFVYACAKCWRELVGKREDPSWRTGKVRSQRVLAEKDVSPQSTLPLLDGKCAR